MCVFLYFESLHKVFKPDPLLQNIAYEAFSFLQNYFEIAPQVFHFAVAVTLQIFFVLGAFCRFNNVHSAYTEFKIYNENC